jgi:hypothetical protein
MAVWRIKPGSFAPCSGVSPSRAGPGAELLRITPLHIVRGGAFDDDSDEYGSWEPGAPFGVMMTTWQLSELGAERRTSTDLTAMFAIRLETFEWANPPSFGNAGAPLLLLLAAEDVSGTLSEITASGSGRLPSSYPGQLMAPSGSN